MILYLAGDVRWSGALHATGDLPRPKTSVLCNLGEPRRHARRPWSRCSATCCHKAGIHIEFQPSFQIPNDAVHDGQGQIWVQKFLSLLEEEVRLHPDNSNEYFFWPTGDEEVAA